MIKYNIKITTVKPRRWNDLTVSADSGIELTVKTNKELHRLNERIVPNYSESNIWKTYGIIRMPE